MKRHNNTDVIRLRAMEPEDPEFMYAMENDSDSWIYSRTIAPLSEEQLRIYALTYDANPLREGQIRLIVDLERKPIGIADLYKINTIDRNAYVGIIIAPEYRGQGYATEALRLLENYAYRNLNLRNLGAIINETNTPSLALFRKSGYKHVGTLSDWIEEPGNHIVDQLIFQKSLGKTVMIGPRPPMTPYEE